MPCTCGPPLHLGAALSPVSATAGTVPGNGTAVAVPGDSSVCDDSTAQPTAAVACPPPCPRGLSPVSYQTMRMPINSLGFSLQVHGTFCCRCHAPKGSNEPLFAGHRPTSFPRCLRLRGLSLATAQSLRFLWTLRIVTILPSSQPPLLHVCAVPAGTVPGAAPNDADANKISGIFAAGAWHLLLQWRGTLPACCRHAADQTPCGVRSMSIGRSGFGALPVRFWVRWQWRLPAGCRHAADQRLEPAVGRELLAAAEPLTNSDSGDSGRRKALSKLDKLSLHCAKLFIRAIKGTPMSPNESAILNPFLQTTYLDVKM